MRLVAAAAVAMVGTGCTGSLPPMVVFPDYQETSHSGHRGYRWYLSSISDSGCSRIRSDIAAETRTRSPLETDMIWWVNGCRTSGFDNQRGYRHAQIGRYLG